MLAIHTCSDCTEPEGQGLGAFPHVSLIVNTTALHVHT